MQYLGGKSRIANEIATVIRGRHPDTQNVYEPFVGGGSVTVALAKKFPSVLASDSCEDLILMWQALQEGWTPPTHVSESEYGAARYAKPSALRSFIGFGSSFGGKWFGGFARGKTDGVVTDYGARAARVLTTQTSFLNNVVFTHSTYTDITPARGDVLYLDPPYAGTTSYKAVTKFDSVRFWLVANTWREIGCAVYVSEQVAPPGWKPIWEKKIDRGLRGDRKTSRSTVDRLYI